MRGGKIQLSLPAYGTNSWNVVDQEKETQVWLILIPIKVELMLFTNLLYGIHKCALVLPYLGYILSLRRL